MILRTVLNKRLFIQEILGLAIIFVLSRVLLAIFGIQFDMSPLQWFYQYIDPLLLKERLVQSLMYLHSQPPAFNLYLGIILKYGGMYAPLLFRTSYLLAGLFSAITIYTVMRLLNIHHLVAFFCTAFFMVSPPAFLYENWLFYTYPLTSVLIVSSLLLLLSLETRSRIYLFLFFSTLSILVLTRTLFHTVWFIAILCWIMFHHKTKKRIVMSALVPLLVLLSVHAKNVFLFDQTSLTSWFGMNLIKMTFTVPRHVLHQDIKNGRVSGIAEIKPFQRPEVYQEFLPVHTATGIPVLDNTHKSTGAINFNYDGYRAVSAQYFTAARRLIARYPHYYCQSVIIAVYQFLRPCSDSIIFSGHNRRIVSGWVTVYETYLLGDILKNAWQTTFTNRSGQQRPVHMNLLYLFIPALYLFGILIASKKLRSLSLSRNQMLTFRYLMFNIGYVSLAGNLFDASENMRFRFIIVPSLYVIIGMFITYCIIQYRSKTSSTQADPHQRQD
ncbi:MAG: hypothetical protein JSW02_02955 [candidate division WOR-3 bacterium]|nr:MAG: hypothetical protein JSW02_02955 [candidate division WOR-3 bacterium]